MPTSKVSIVYNMSFFLSASHWVVFQGQKGEIHPHIWELEMQILDKSAYSTQPTYGFADIDKMINRFLAGLENTCLNEHNLFNSTMPSTENIAAIFYREIKAVLQPYSLILKELKLKETPTRGVIVTDSISEGSEEKSDLYKAGAVDFDTSPLQNSCEFICDDSDYLDYLQPVIDGQEAAVCESELSAANTETAELLEDEEELVSNRPTDLSVSEHIESSASASGRKSILFSVLSIVIILAANGLIYYQLLSTYPQQSYPWGSDVWGHLYKAKFLYQAILDGNLYPQYFPWWYNGIQLFRYWAPVPYYLLAGLIFLCKDIYLANICYVIFCSVIGSLGWLTIHRYIGRIPALLIAALWIINPDNLRVIFTEGNIPRTLSMALVPLAIYFALEIYHEHAGPVKKLVYVLLLSLAVLTHAMLGAILVAGLCIWLLLSCWFEHKSIYFAMRFVLLSFCGVMLTCWWLIPALSGGITSIDSKAAQDAIYFFPFSLSLNPFLRAGNAELFYLGISYMGLLLFGFFNWSNRKSYQKSALIIGALIFLSTTTIIKPLYLKMPLSSLIWPLRLVTFGMGMILIGSVNWNFYKDAKKGNKRIAIMVFVLVIGLAFIDSYQSLSFAHFRTYPAEIASGIKAASTQEGFKLAAVDIGQFGSLPTYVSSSEFEREQVFGWAWQGAQTGPNISRINTALDNNWYNYAIDRLQELGASQLLLKKDTLDNNISFEKSAMAAGYSRTFENSIASVYSLKGGPYAITADYKAFAIGRGGTYAAMVFPLMYSGESVFIDDYSLQDLLDYDVLFLSAFDWHNKETAEQRVTDYVEAGGRAIVDLTGVKSDTFSSRPVFLGVHGEPVSLVNPAAINHEKEDYYLQSFDEDNIPWIALTLDGLDRQETTMYYRGNEVAIGGYKDIGQGELAFVGLNLPYHVFLTHDSSALTVLEDYLKISAGEVPKRTIIPLPAYTANGNGCNVTIDIPPELEEKSIILPIAFLDSLQIKLSDQSIQISELDNLIAVKGKAGVYKMEISSTWPPGTIIGLLISLLVLLLLLQGAMRKHFGRIAGKTFLLLLFTVLIVAGPVKAALAVTTDGEFGDWYKQAHVSDPFRDTKKSAADLKSMYWSSEWNESKIYFMFERYTKDGASLIKKNRQNSAIFTRIYFDIDDNGSYSDRADRWAQVEYNTSGKVDVELYNMQGDLLWSQTAYWGETKESGLRYEFYLPYNKLNLIMGQNFRVFAEASHSNSFKDVDIIPDRGDIQISPVPSLGWYLFSFLLVMIMITGIAGINKYKKREYNYEQ